MKRHGHLWEQVVIYKPMKTRGMAEPPPDKNWLPKNARLTIPKMSAATPVIRETP
jgi:hypothetical protein